ncbi:MAG: cytochrome P450 [Pseudomonadota bacterium]
MAPASPYAVNALYRPPAPQPMPPLRSLLRVMREGNGNLLSLVPSDAYTKPVTHLGYSRRSIILVNDPDAVRDVMTDPLGIFPKNDLFVGALEPLVGDSIFVSHGETWRKQREMIDPAFSQLRIRQAYPAMVDAVRAADERLAEVADSGEPLSLDVLTSQLTADVICRTIFSEPLDGTTAQRVFHLFSRFERSVASVSLRQLIFGKPWDDVRQPTAVLEACEEIRALIGEMVDPRLAEDDGGADDIVAAVIRATDPQTGEPFTRSELIDELGVFFLAGHETTASALTWAIFMLSQQPKTLSRLRAEVAERCGDDLPDFESVKQLAFVRSVFRESLRLYPPITFIPRVAAEATTIADVRIKRGAMVMVSPWTTHRNSLQWRDPDRFDPDRFMPGAEPDERPNTFLSFGLGPRVCIGAAFATVESALILAGLAARYDFEPLDAEHVWPVARLTTRPAREIQCRVRRRAT